MTSGEVTVFFYGLFMDESLLATRGITPSRAVVACLDGFRLRIGRRATLVRDEAARTHGVLMSVPAEQLTALYSEESVADYVPESVTVAMPDGTMEPAACYNLPGEEPEGANPAYAEALLELARRLDLPEDYVQEIRKQIP